MTKADQRRDARAVVARLTPEEQQTQSRRLMERLEPWLNTTFETALATLPLPGEPDLTPLWERWTRTGRALALARMRPDRSLDFGLVSRWDPSWSGWSPTLRSGPTAPLWNGRNAVLLIPGLAFAPWGPSFARLGRGGGSFDRWLAARPDGVVTVGFGYREQRWESVVVEPHDQPIDLLATPDGIEGTVKTAD